METEEQEQDQPLCCDSCSGEVAPDGDSHDVDGAFWCDSCYDNSYECYECTKRFMTDDMTSVDGGTYVCRSCFVSTYYHCEWCDDGVGSRHDRYTCQGDDICYGCWEYSTYYCDSCDENHNQNYTCTRASIHGYSYTPYPLIFRSIDETGADVQSQREPSYNKTTRDRQVFMGFEIEVESAHASFQEGVQKFDNEDLIYLKEDGSLDDGFEAVSHPTTFASYYKMQDKFFRPFEELSDLGFKSWRASTCGMHVHISRNAFVGKSHLWRFAFFINSNPRQMQRMAGRSSDRWATFEGQREYSSKVIAGKNKYGSERYCAVNLSNADTVEIRIFRGSLLRRRILGNLGLCDLIVKFTRDLTVKDVNDKRDSWSEFIKFAMSQADPMYESTQFYLRKYFVSPTFGEPSEDN